MKIGKRSAAEDLFDGRGSYAQAVCCSVLQFVAVCCGVLRCVAVGCSVC